MILQILEPKTKRTGKRVLCKCDWCGNEFESKYAEQTRRDKKKHFCNWNCYDEYLEISQNNNNFKNGYYSKGYKTYRKIYTEYYKTELDSNTAIHHINGDRKDHRIENLIAMPRSEHTALHNRGA